VVGGAGGVGMALLDKLVDRGATLAVTVLNAGEAAQVTVRHAGKLTVHEVDLANADTALERFRSIGSSMGDLDAAVVCAGIAPNGPVEVSSLEAFRRTFEVNCLANVALYQALLPLLRRRGGKVVLISSTSGRMGMPFVGAYTASKYALEGIADVMRREAAPQGVKVSIVEPGGIRTNMIKDQLATGMARLAALPDDQRARYGYLFRRFEVLAGGALETSASTPGQVADAILDALDAADPDARYVVGDDAKQMIGLVNTLPDRALDALFAQMFSQNPADQAGWASSSDTS
jgi:NAD(P)-dependent dehydrogenase (short-subunit alcohol dehydrogenase family)